MSVEAVLPAPGGTTRHTIRDGVSAIVRHLASAAAGLLTIPLIARSVGNEALGAWAVLGTASFLLGLADLGLSTAVYRARSESGEAERRMIGLSLLSVTVVAPVLAVLAFVTIDAPHATQALRDDLTRAAGPALFAGIVGAIAFPYRAYVMLRGGVSHLARARVAASVTQVVVTVGVLRIAPSLLAPALGLLFSALLETGLTVRAARLIDPRVPLRPSFPSDRTELKSALRDGSAGLAVNIAVAAALRIDVMILARVAPLVSVAAYSVASRAVDQSFTLAKQASTALLPRLSDPKSRDAALRAGTATLGALVASGMAALAFDGRALLAAWAGSVATSWVAVHALGLLAIAAVLASVHEVATSALTLGGRSAWDGALPDVIGCTVNVTISIAGARHYGVWAVAGGTIIGNGIVALLVWYRVRTLLGWSGSRVLRALAPTATAAATSVGIGWGLADLASGGPLASVMACVATAGLGCGAAAYVARRVSA